MRPHFPALVPLALYTLLSLGCSAPGDSPDAPLAPVARDLASQGAGPPQAGSGTGLIQTLEILSNRQAGQNRIQERRITGTVTGTLEGTFVQLVRGVVHDATGQVTFQGTMEFTGTLADCGTGMLTLGITGRGQAGAAPVTEGNVRVIDQAGNTLAASGSGTVSQVGPALSYEIRYVCR